MGYSSKSCAETPASLRDFSRSASSSQFSVPGWVPAANTTEPLSRAMARESGSVVFAAGTHPGTENWEEDAEREKSRKDAGVSAQLFEEYPIRFWDHYLGPRERHLQLIP